MNEPLKKGPRDRRSDVLRPHLFTNDEAQAVLAYKAALKAFAVIEAARLQALRTGQAWDFTSRLVWDQAKKRVETERRDLDLALTPEVL
jgi:hypothetical protein